MASVLIEERNKAAADALIECIQACHACNYRCCEGSAQMGACGRSCIDCATICEVVLTLLARDSRWAAQARQLCSEVCTSCAAECEEFDDEYCLACARACRACAESCL